MLRIWIWFGIGSDTYSKTARIRIRIQEYRSSTRKENPNVLLTQRDHLPSFRVFTRDIKKNFKTESMRTKFIFILYIKCYFYCIVNRYKKNHNVRGPRRVRTGSGSGSHDRIWIGSGLVFVFRQKNRSGSESASVLNEYRSATLLSTLTSNITTGRKMHQLAICSHKIQDLWKVPHKLSYLFSWGFSASF